jgi:hypothetical protein
VSETGLLILSKKENTPEGLWASGILQSLEKAATKRVHKTLKSCGWAPDTGETYLGVVDDTVETGDAIVGLVKFDPLSGKSFRWEGSAWTEIPEELEPAGLPYVILDNDLPTLADVVEALAGKARGVLLSPAQPKTSFHTNSFVQPSLVAAAPVDTGQKYFAVVDDNDPSKVLELFTIVPGPTGPVSMLRRTKIWVRDDSLLRQLKGLDPPRVIEIPSDKIEAVVKGVDEYDEAHPKEASKPFELPVGQNQSTMGYTARAPRPKPYNPGPVKADVGPPAFSTMPPALKHYWTRGRGALRVRWGLSGDFRRCTRALSRYLPLHEVDGACANLHKLAVGFWPGEHTK